MGWLGAANDSACVLSSAAQRGGWTIGKLGRHCHGFALHCLVRHRHRDETHRVCFLAAECISDTNQGPSASMTLPSSKPVR